MHRFTRNFLTEWRRLRLPFAGKIFVAAISGGADSVSLALALNELRNRKKLNLRFVLAHFNHNLRGRESLEDERFVKNLAQKFEFELACATQNHESKIENQKGNLEQNARFARYQFLFETAANLDADGILTAHTLNDQAETFLLNLIRGSGLEGLGGMKPVRSLRFDVRGSKFENEIPDSDSSEESEIETLTLDESKSEIENRKSKIRVIRPLLRWAKRADTENFCRLNEIEFRLDSMNEDLAFKRVRVRKILLPLLADFNPQIIETLGKTAELLGEDAEQLAIGNRHLMENRRRSVSNEEHSAENPLSAADNAQSGDEIAETAVSIDYLLLEDLRSVFPSMRRFIVREWLKDKRGDLRRLTAKHFEAVENLMLSRKSGRVIELPGNELIVKKDGKLFFEKTKVEKSRTANYNQKLFS